MSHSHWWVVNSVFVVIEHYPCFESAQLYHKCGRLFFYGKRSGGVCGVSELPYPHILGCFCSFGRAFDLNTTQSPYMWWFIIGMPQYVGDTPLNAYPFYSVTAKLAQIANFVYDDTCVGRSNTRRYADENSQRLWRNPQLSSLSRN